MTRRVYFSDDGRVTVERLSDLSIDALYALAEKMGLDLPSELERVFVVEALLEAFEEDNEDRKALGDAAVHIEEKKYSGSELDEIDASLDAAPCIECRYNETVIHVIARDPAWAFVFWDIKDEEFDQIYSTEGYSHLFLRVVKESGYDRKGQTSFEVTVGDDDNRWYLHLPDEDRNYRIDLYAKIDSKSRLLARSPVLRTPRALMADSLSDLDSSAARLAALSGLASLEIVQAPEYHPARILGGFDE
ncbi:hypothetical protein MASR2M48_06230 [Spirochaetota bacterium]